MVLPDHLVCRPYLVLVHPSVPARTVKTRRAGQGKTASSIIRLPNGMRRTSPACFQRRRGEYYATTGAAPALTAFLSGEASLLFNNPITALPHMRSGRARVLAVTSAKRLAAAPEIPTLAEAGVRGVEVGSWSALLAPAGTPAENIMRLHNELKRIVGTSEMRSRLVAEGAEPIGAGPDELAAFIKSELPKWAKVVAQSKARID